MISKQKKWTALFVAMTFLWLLQISAMPLQGEHSPDQSDTTIETPEKAPDFIEEEGAPNTAKKKSIMPIVLIGLGVVAVAAVVALVVLKTSYDITGTWTINIDFTTAGYTDYTSTWVFTGTKESGTFVENDQGTTYNGTYTVTNKKEVWFKYNSYSDTYVGKFDSKDKMSGTFSTATYNGTWTATKTSSSTAAVPSLPHSAAAASIFRHDKK